MFPDILLAIYCRNAQGNIFQRLAGPLPSPQYSDERTSITDANCLGASLTFRASSTGGPCSEQSLHNCVGTIALRTTRSMGPYSVEAVVSAPDGQITTITYRDGAPDIKDLNVSKFQLSTFTFNCELLLYQSGQRRTRKSGRCASQPSSRTPAPS